MHTALKLSIIIPTYNGAHLLRENLDAILEAAQKTGNFELIIVDNGSTDDTKRLSEQYKSINWIFLPENTGFAGACMTGARKAHGTYLLFINNDCVPEEDSFVTLLHYMDEHPTRVATQPMVKKRTGDVEHIGFWIDTAIGKAHSIQSKDEYEEVQKKGRVYGLSGTCLLVKRDVFEKMGGFDTSFHSYLEDVDLAITLHEQGYSVAPCFETSVTHAHRATSSKMGNYKERQDMKNWWKIIHKHPKTFKKTIQLYLERLRNVNGYRKTWYNN